MCVFSVWIVLQQVNNASNDNNNKFLLNPFVHCSLLLFPALEFQPVEYTGKAKWRNKRETEWKKKNSQNWTIFLLNAFSKKNEEKKRKSQFTCTHIDQNLKHINNKNDIYSIYSNRMNAQDNASRSSTTSVWIWWFLLFFCFAFFFVVFKTTILNMFST